MKSIATVAAMCAALGSSVPAQAWPSLTDSSTSIHIELPAVHLPSLITASIHDRVRPQPLHFPPIDIRLPGNLERVATPKDLVERVVYSELPQFLAAAVCTFAAEANDKPLSRPQSDVCEKIVSKLFPKIGGAAVSAAEDCAREIDESASGHRRMITVGTMASAGKGGDLVPTSSSSMNEVIVEAICEASAAEACAVASPDACASVLSSSLQREDADLAPHGSSSAEVQAGCENEATAACATLLQAVCESSGHAVVLVQSARKEKGR
jgi:hypothetical protein